MSEGTFLGRPLPRVDGPLKVRGRASYASDHALAQRPLIGWIVEAKAAPGALRVDASRAREVAGVVEVLTHENAPAQRPRGEPADADRFTQSHALLAAPRVAFYGEPVALVVAESLEVARHAARLVEVEVDAEEGRFAVTGDEPSELQETPDELDGGTDADVSQGDFDAAWAEAAVRVDATYRTAGQIAAAMEPHATLAEWDGERLTVHTSIQIVGSGVTALANTLNLEEDRIRVLSPFVGGGFGSKLGIHGDAVLASLAALELGRPVRVVQTRRNAFASAPHRGSSIQRVRLGASEAGELLAVAHESLMPMSRGYAFAEACAATARAAYACRGLRTRHRVISTDLPAIDSLRAPGEAVGSLAFESAVDELARALGQDPLDLRLRNLARREPMSGKPFASYDLGRCLEAGAERYGWRQRGPGGAREGDWLIGHGLAAATRPNFLSESRARVSLDEEGQAAVELDMTDIGTGTYTLLTQIAADALGLPLERVQVRLADSDLPRSSGSGGSFGAASAGGAVHRACQQLRRQLEAGGPRSAEGHLEPGEDQEEYAQYMYGAHFVEVAVNAITGEPRLRRAVGAFSFGRVLNPLTARSQLIGAMTFGIGGALLEELLLDPRTGAYVNRDLAEYHVPVNRDVPRLDVLLLEEPDPRCGPLASKGVGELGICGIGAAIANGIHDATGVRVREFPLTLDKILPGLPPL
ncbi:MAG: xanthine dehydrogenase family protein molybdopterin-binding subunit [Planctomycetota bacterium]